MALTLVDLLNWKAMTGTVRDPSGGVPNILPPAFLNITEQVPGNQVAWDILANTRQLAKSVAPGSPSVRRALQTVGRNSATIPRFAEHIEILGERLSALRGFGSVERQEKAAEWVRHQVEEAGRRFTNTRISMIMSALVNGKIWLKSDGSGGYDIQHNSSGADITIDLQVPSNNTGNLNGTLSDWSASATNILNNLQDVLDLAVRASGLQIRHVFYGKNVRDYIIKNNHVKELLKTDAMLANSLKTGGIPDGFGDQQLQWHPLQRSFFNDASGTNRNWSSGNELVFVPEPTRDWYELVEGMELLPSGALGTFGDANDALGASTETFGQAAYAKLEDDPVKVKQVSVDNVLPIFKVPSAVFIGNATG